MNKRARDKDSNDHKHKLHSENLLENDPANQWLKTDIKIHYLYSNDDIPDWTSIDAIAEWLNLHMRPWEDSVEDIKRGLLDAFRTKSVNIIAAKGGQLAGVTCLVKTGFSGYIPPNFMVFCCVSPEFRRKGIGETLFRSAFKVIDGSGPCKLHVEYDNPARRLYERMGFESKYAEMRRKDPLST